MRPARAARALAERFRALVDVWPVLLVFGLVVGGIYPWLVHAHRRRRRGRVRHRAHRAFVNGNLTWALLKDSDFHPPPR
jgi:C4-dicarboxylate transporter DctM subunit